MLAIHKLCDHSQSKMVMEVDKICVVKYFSNVDLCIHSLTFWSVNGLLANSFGKLVIKLTDLCIPSNIVFLEIHVVGCSVLNHC